MQIDLSKSRSVEPVKVGAFNNQDITLTGFLEDSASAFDGSAIVSHGGETMLLGQLEKFSNGAIEWADNADELLGEA
jgi:hypothetical protein